MARRAGLDSNERLAEPVVSVCPEHGAKAFEFATAQIESFVPFFGETRELLGEKQIDGFVVFSEMVKVGNMVAGIGITDGRALARAVAGIFGRLHGGDKRGDFL